MEREGMDWYICGVVSLGCGRVRNEVHYTAL